jgi:hypothetical protein
VLSNPAQDALALDRGHGRLQGRLGVARRLALFQRHAQVLAEAGQAQRVQPAAVAFAVGGADVRDVQGEGEERQAGPALRCGAARGALGLKLLQQVPAEVPAEGRIAFGEAGHVLLEDEAVPGPGDHAQAFEHGRDDLKVRDESGVKPRRRGAAAPPERFHVHPRRAAGKDGNGNGPSGAQYGGHEAKCRPRHGAEAENRKDFSRGPIPDGGGQGDLAAGEVRPQDGGRAGLAVAPGAAEEPEAGRERLLVNAGGRGLPDEQDQQQAPPGVGGALSSSVGQAEQQGPRLALEAPLIPGLLHRQLALAHPVERAAHGQVERGRLLCLSLLAAPRVVIAVQDVVLRLGGPLDGIDDRVELIPGRGIDRVGEAG